METKSARPWPRTREALNLMIQQAYRDGYDMGHSHGYQKGRASVMPEKKLRFLEAVTQYASATGQTLQALGRTLESMKGQL